MSRRLQQRARTGAKIERTPLLVQVGERVRWSGEAHHALVALRDARLVAPTAIPG